MTPKGGIMKFTEKMARFAINGMIDTNGNLLNFDNIIASWNPMDLMRDVETVALQKGKTLDCSAWDILVLYLTISQVYPASLDTHERRVLWLAEHLSDKGYNPDELFNEYFA
jgi:hypothetical protein